MKHLMLFFMLAGMLACNSGDSKSGAGAAKKGGLIFQFSDRASAMDMNDPNNWCAAQFGEAALISADPKNFYRRAFALSDIPSKLVVDWGHQSATLMLHKEGNQILIYTGENLPACLSKRENIQIAPEGTSFHYNNRMNVSFDAYLEELPNGVQIVIDLPVDGGHGIAVVRCPTCQ